MKRNDLFRPLAVSRRRINEYRDDVHGPVRIRNYRRTDVRDFFYGRARQANFSQFDSEKYPNNGFSKAQLNDSLSNLEKDTFVDWIQEGIQKLNNKKKPIKDRALSSIFSMDNLLHSKPKEILKQIQNSSAFGYGLVQISKSAVNTAIYNTLNVHDINIVKTNSTSDTIDLLLEIDKNIKKDYMANNSISLVKSAVSQVTGFASSIISGAMAGSAAGPIGAAVGATISAATYGFKSWIQTKEAESKFYQTLNASRSQSAFSLQRAGLTDGGRGTEN